MDSVLRYDLILNDLCTSLRLFILKLFVLLVSTVELPLITHFELLRVLSWKR